MSKEIELKSPLNYSNERNSSNNKFGLSNYIDSIYLFNISITPKIYVVLGIGIGNIKKSVGSSAHWNIETAIENTLDEMIEFFGASHHKSLNKRTQKQSKDTVNDIYTAYFHSLGIKELMDKYNFLLSDYRCLDQPTNNIDIDTEKDFYSLMMDISVDLDIELLIASIPVRYQNDIFKVTEILSLDGYPHMNVTLFDDDNRRKYGIESISNQNIEPIPFP